MTDHRVMKDDLLAFAQEVFLRAGLPKEDAGLVANCLVQVDLRGVVSHGTRQLGRYLNEFRGGVINPKPEVRLIRQAPISALFDGDAGIGYIVATTAAQTLIEKASASGIAVVGTRHHGHIGSVGIYARMAIARDLVFFGVAGGAGWRPLRDSEATVFDAIASPPTCFGIPSAEGPPFVLDINTNIFESADALHDAMERFPGALIRSMGLKFVPLILGGALAGTMPPGESVQDYRHADRGSLMVAFRPDTIGDLGGFKREVTRLITQSRQLKPLPGLDSTQVAGSLEWERERAWSKEGIPLSEAHVQGLQEVADSVSIQMPRFLRPSP